MNAKDSQNCIYVGMWCGIMRLIWMTVSLSVLSAHAVSAQAVSAQAVSATGRCIDVVHPGPLSGMCKGTTMPFRACVPDKMTIAVLEKNLAYEMHNAAAADFFKTAQCYTIMNNAKTECPGGSVWRGDICDVGGAFSPALTSHSVEWGMFPLTPHIQAGLQRPTLHPPAL